MYVMVLAMLSTVSFAQVKIQGLITGRSGPTVIVQTSNAAPLVNVLLTDDTRVAQVQGVFKARKKDMSMAALVPGLAIKVEGSYDEDHNLVAKQITFKGNDLEQADAIQAGLSETKAQTKQNEAELQKQMAALQAQNAELQKHQEQLKAHEEKIAANKTLIDANTARFGQLDDYYIYDEYTVYFGNGKVGVDPNNNAPLIGLANKATTVEGYMIQVKGYASKSGSTALNQKLSEQRAANVTTILLQQAHVPMSRMLAPGAMGESQGPESDKPVDDSENANRRVVVRVLQNKGIAGIQ
jgi:outer membrane protein OmpA-like peptidoglycan-associated protein